MGQCGPVRGATAQPVLGARFQLDDAVGELRELVTQPIELPHAAAGLRPEQRELLLVDGHGCSGIPRTAATSAASGTWVLTLRPSRVGAVVLISCISCGVLWSVSPAL